VLTVYLYWYRAEVPVGQDTAGQDQVVSVPTVSGGITTAGALGGFSWLVVALAVADHSLVSLPIIVALIR